MFWKRISSSPFVRPFELSKQHFSLSNHLFFWAHFNGWKLHSVVSCFMHAWLHNKRKRSDLNVEEHNAAIRPRKSSNFYLLSSFIGLVLSFYCCLLPVDNREREINIPCENDACGNYLRNLRKEREEVGKKRPWQFLWTLTAENQRRRQHLSCRLLDTIFLTFKESSKNLVQIRR